MVKKPAAHLLSVSLPLAMPALLGISSHAAGRLSDMPEGSIVRVPLPRDILKAAAVLGHEVSQLVDHFAHFWV